MFISESLPEPQVDVRGTAGFGAYTKIQENVNMIFFFFPFFMALLCLFSAAVLLIFWFVCLVRLKHACLKVYLELKFKLFLLRYVFLKI